MKKLSLILFTFLIILMFVYLFVPEDKKVIITYKYTKEGIEIIESNISNLDVFLCPQPFRIYREKYKDTISIGIFRNGKQQKWGSASETKNGETIIVCGPFPNGEKVFEIENIIGIDKKQKEKVRLALIKNDTIYTTTYAKFTKEYPIYYFIKPKNKIIIKYKQKNILEKGKYKLFFYKKGYVEEEKYNLLPEFKLLSSDEIEDNPLEFEVK